MIVPFWTGRRGFARLCGLLRSEMASRMPGVSGLGEVRIETLNSPHYAGLTRRSTP